LGITGNFTADDKVYDGNTDATVLTRTLDGVLAGDDGEVSLTGGTASFDTKNIGVDKTVTLTGMSLSGVEAGNYNLAIMNTTLADITAKELTPHIVAEDKTYDGTTTATLSDQYVTGMVSGEANVDLLVTAANFDSKHVGDPKTVTATGLSLNGAQSGNYMLADGATATDQATINIRPMNIIADDGQSKVYGEDDPAEYTYTVSNEAGYYGLASGDAFVGAVDDRIEGESVGNYAIQRGTLAIFDDNGNGENMESNYNITFTSNDFEITQRPITITADAGQGKTYGNDDPTLTYTLTSGTLAFDESFSGALSRDAGENVGTYTINKGTLTIVDQTSSNTESNYDLTYVNDVFTITTRPITLVADDQTKTYGDAAFDLGNTAFTVSATQGDGMATGETIASVTLESPGEAEYADVGDYTITISGAVAGTSTLLSNYEITYTNGNLTIGPRDLVLTDFAATDKVYDGTVSVTGTGWVDNRKAGDLLSFTFDAAFAEANAGVGKDVNYTNIQITGGDDMNNYSLQTTSGTATATIEPKPLDITANDITKTYGTTYTFDGTEFTTGEMVTGESIASVSLTSLGAPSDADPGDYPIEASNALAGSGTLLSNYTISYIDGTMTVGPATNTNVTGTVAYHHAGDENTPLPGFTVSILDSEGNSIDQIQTDADGAYLFENVNPADIATLQIASDMNWGGVSATDALAMQLYSVGTPPTYWNPEALINHTADLNSNGMVNTQDASIAKGRVLYPADPAYDYAAGDWAFYANGQPLPNTTGGTESDDYTAEWSNPTIDESGNIPGILVRTYGDVNGSYMDPPADELITLQGGEVMQVGLGESFELPVRVMDKLDMSAMTLILQYDSNKIAIDGIASELGGLQFDIKANTVRMVWSNPLPEHFNAGEALLHLQMRTIDQVASDEHVLMLDGATEFADAFAAVIPNVTLEAPFIDNMYVGVDPLDVHHFDITAQPNPFRDRVTISYELPEAARVQITLTDMTGSTVDVLTEKNHLAGHHSLVYDPKGQAMDGGIYFVKFHVIGDDTEFIKTKKLVYIVN
ncbi:MAG: hypothetical protein K9I94_11380, partial [Bacteroidales bacterium]|nr:hypothetical protein [Bacteroidales bacterium]